MKIATGKYLIDTGLVTHIEPPTNYSPGFFIYLFVGGQEIYVPSGYDEFLKYWEPEGKFVTIK